MVFGRKSRKNNKFFSIWNIRSHHLEPFKSKLKNKILKSQRSKTFLSFEILYFFVFAFIWGSSAVSKYTLDFRHALDGINALKNGENSGDVSSENICEKIIYSCGVDENPKQLQFEGSQEICVDYMNSIPITSIPCYFGNKFVQGEGRYCNFDLKLNISL